MPTGSLLMSNDEAAVGRFSLWRRTSRPPCPVSSPLLTRRRSEIWHAAEKPGATRRAGSRDTLDNSSEVPYGGVVLLGS